MTNYINEYEKAYDSSLISLHNNIDEYIKCWIKGESTDKMIYMLKTEIIAAKYLANKLFNDGHCHYGEVNIASRCLYSELRDLVAGNEMGLTRELLPNDRHRLSEEIKNLFNTRADR